LANSSDVIIGKRSDVTITNKKEETCLKACFLFLVCNYNVSMQQMKCHGNGRRKEAQIGEFMYRHTVKVEHEMYGYISNNGSTGIVTICLKKSL